MKVNLCIILHIFILLGCIALALGIGLGLIWQNEIFLSHQIRDNCKIINSTASPYKCCIQTNCECEYCNLNVDCSQLINELKNGSCCAHTCYDEDEPSINICEVKCGVCNNIDFEYTYLNSSIYKVGLWNCNINDYDCVRTFNIGNDLNCWYDDRDIIRVILFNLPPLFEGWQIFLIILACIIFFSYLIVIIILKICYDKCC